MTTDTDAERALTAESSSGHSTRSLIPASDEREILRRIDLRMLPLLGLVYSFAVVDRSNLGIASVVGMGRDLELSVGERFSIVSVLFFVPYTLFQLPSNLIIRKVGPRYWLPGCVLGWGAAQVAMGFSTHWGHLAICRILLGAFESGFFPAMVLIITTWYKRHEVQKRLGAFYVLSIIVAGFGSILGYGISKLDGRRGIRGWSWIFIIEGSFTLFLGLLSLVVLPDFPHHNSWLNADDTKFVLDRIQEDRGDAKPDELTRQVFVHHLKDWTIWVTGLMYMCSTMAASVVGYFSTIILNGMGWGTEQSLLLTTPPYIFAGVSIMFFAWISDKLRRRAIFLAIQALMTMVGLFMTLYCELHGWRYAGIFLTAAGSSGGIPGVIAYSSNNVVSHTKRAVASAITITFGGIGGIFATTVFRQQDYPKYLPGMWAAIGCQFLALVLLAITTTHYSRQNRLMREGKLDRPLEGQPGFFYTL